MTHDVDTFRLTQSDLTRIHTAIVEAIGSEPHPTSTAAIERAERVARHAIGCSADDLRDCEIRFIADRVGEIARDTEARR